MIVANLRTYTYYINSPPSDDGDEYKTVFVNVFVKIGNVIKINACALGHKLPIYQLFKGVVCDFLFWRLAKSVPSDDKMKEMESTQWDQWKQVPSSNDVRVVVSFWKLSGHLNSYCQRVQKFKIQCRNVLGVIY